MKRMFAVGLFVSLVFLASCANGEETGVAASQSSGSSTAPPQLTADEIALGKTVYASSCASCHGVNLEGQEDWKLQNDDGSFRAPPHTAEGHTWHHPDPVLIEAISKGGARFEGLNIGGTSNMPAFVEILTEEEIQAVLVYIKSTWPENIRALQYQQSNLEPSS